MTITKVGFRGGAWFGKHFYLIFFLLLGAMILLTSLMMYEADARSEDEPVCYTSACEKAKENIVKNAAVAILRLDSIIPLLS